MQRMARPVNRFRLSESRTMAKKVRHILSLSGGKDSAALAVYLRDRIPEMEYIFHDTGKELPETYAFIERLEAYLGRRIHRTTSEFSFEKWLTIYGGMIPSNYRRWCTRMLKLRPFEKYVGKDPVFNYVAIRADEERVGYISHKENITPVYPFRDDGLVYGDVIRILNESGLGLPKYTEWGRTRSGCFFCFYQQKIEWVRLKETYPDLFEEAKAYEYANKKNGNAFYWSGNESLEELEQPERVAEIKRQWELSQLRRKAAGSTSKSLLHILGQAEEEDEPREGCLICQL
jgi:3'-phosphoadenosine 5'-phosphosulfate sulfotransferase (PAPS reductase)/FAD synthetase